MLHLSDYRKSYGAQEILKINDLVIEPGIYWLQGANGSGKSTLLKSIAGIIWFDGDVTVDKISVKKDPVAYRSIVNFCSAEPVFPPSLTGSDMIALFSQAKKANQTQQRSLIDSVNISQFLDQPIGSYSSGMKKKLALVLSFLGDARLILLDEPLITLDPDSLDVVYNWIRERHQQASTSFILSSHQPLNEEAMPGSRKMFIEKASLTF